MFENWRSYINEQENEPASEITDPEVAERTQKAATEIQQLKQQLEITYGYEVIQVISDFYLPVEYV